MIYIDPSPHPYFKSLSKYIELRLKEPCLITDDYTLEGGWILNYVSMLNDVHLKIKGEYIAIQSEQMNVKSTKKYLDFLKNAREVWDLSTNYKIGYSEAWRLEMEEAKDIDILFYGELNERREKILNQIPNVDILCPQHNNAAHGPDLQKIIMQSKIILSIHYYPDPMNDMARIAPLLSNKCFVIAEECTEDWFNNCGGLVVAPASKIPELCEFYLKNPFGRIKWQDRGYDFIKSL